MPVTKRPAVVLVSGGMDSCLTAALACREGPCHFLHISYGQRTETRERQAFEEICRRLQPAAKHLTRADHLRQFGGSSLVDPSLPLRKEGLAPGIPQSYVPFRNGLFLAIAAGLAEVIGADRLYIGAVEEDSSGYPDCRRVFFRAFERALHEGMRPETQLRIVAPVIDMKKEEIVCRALEVGAPLAATWSCYERQDLACGRCDSCRLRRAAFAAAGVADPIPYLDSQERPT